MRKSILGVLASTTLFLGGCAADTTNTTNRPQPFGSPVANCQPPTSTLRDFLKAGCVDFWTPPSNDTFTIAAGGWYVSPDLDDLRRGALPTGTRGIAFHVASNRIKATLPPLTGDSKQREPQFRPAERQPALSHEVTPQADPAFTINDYVGKPYVSPTTVGKLKDGQTGYVKAGTILSASAGTNMDAGYAISVTEEYYPDSSEAHPVRITHQGNAYLACVPTGIKLPPTGQGGVNKENPSWLSLNVTQGNC